MDRPKVLKRTITPEIRASRERDMETVLDNYRENLRDHGVTDDAAIERFVSEEHSKMQNMKALITATVLQTSITPQLTGKVLLLK